jgi:hypothetical protein
MEKGRIDNDAAFFMSYIRDEDVRTLPAFGMKSGN